MGQTPQPGRTEERSIPTFPGQGEPGTGPGQLGQVPQHQSEHGLEPIPLPENPDGEHCEPVEQSEQNKTQRDHASDQHKITSSGEGF